MAVQMAYSDPFGHDCPASYWYLVGVAFDVTTRRAMLSFNGYVSEEACLAGKLPLVQKQMEVADEAFDALATELAPVIAPVAYAQAVRDDFFKNAKII